MTNAELTATLHHIDALSMEPVKTEGARGVTMQVLLSEKDGAPNFVMRRFQVEPGGCTPLHTHPYEHEAFILEGGGELHAGGRDHALEPNTAIYVPPDALHQFRNTGSEPLRFLCLIPVEQGPCM